MKTAPPSPHRPSDPDGVGAGQGLEVIQTFEPIPLYEVMEMLGYGRADAAGHAGT